MRKESGSISETVLVSLPSMEAPGVIRSPDILIFHELEIHICEQTIYQNDNIVSLTHYEFLTLLHLARHPSWVLSQSAIYEAVWKEPGDKCGSAVVNVVNQIRRKIGDGYIEIVVGSGYRFVG